MSRPLLFPRRIITSYDAFQFHVQCVLKSFKAKEVFIANFFSEIMLCGCGMFLGLETLLYLENFSFVNTNRKG